MLILLTTCHVTNCPITVWKTTYFCNQQFFDNSHIINHIFIHDHTNKLIHIFIQLETYTEVQGKGWRLPRNIYKLSLNLRWNFKIFNKCKIHVYFTPSTFFYPIVNILAPPLLKSSRRLGFACWNPFFVGCVIACTSMLTQVFTLSKYYRKIIEIMDGYNNSLICYVKNVSILREEKDNDPSTF